MMYNIKTLNKISESGLSRFSSENFTVDSDNLPDGIVVRSADMHSMELPNELKCIARAGAGYNNIPVEVCSQKGIVVFNTPGANANAVKELAIGALVLGSRRVVEGIEWAKSLKGKGAEVPALAEKGKGSFVGPELMDKHIGVIGLGAVGVHLANVAVNLGMEVYGYDPYITVEGAWGLSRSVIHSTSLDALFTKCDYISIHVPSNKETRGMINAEAISKMKDGVCIINLARGDLVDNAAILAAVESGKVSRYITDFPEDELLCRDNVIVIPHLGASTPESEENCAVMAVDQISDYLQNGNIKNSVNFPSVSMDWLGEYRLCIINRNVPNMVGSISSILAKDGINIENMVNRSRGDYAYTIIDTNCEISDQVRADIVAVDGVMRLRIISR